MDMQGKGVLIHLPADADGMPPAAYSAPADEDERKHVVMPPEKLRRTAADKGYDSGPLREFLKSRGIRPQIPGKKNAA